MVKEITLEKKILNISWYIVFLFALNGYMDSIGGVLFACIMWGLFLAMDYFFSGSKLNIVVKTVTVIAILYRTGFYGSFLNPLWVVNLVIQLGIDIQYLAFGNLDKIQALPLVSNLILFVVFREYVLPEKSGNRLNVFLIFAGGSLLLFLSIVQGTRFSFLTFIFIFMGIIKMVFENMDENKLYFDREISTVGLTVLIFICIFYIWNINAPINFKYESALTWIQGGFTSVGSGGDRTGVARLSGYNSNDSVLGGPLELSERPVLKMNSPVPTYLRGESKYIYTGTGWTNDIVSKESVKANDIPMPEYPGLQYEDIDISIEVLNGSYPVIFTGLRTTSVDISRGDWIVLTNENDLLINYTITAGDEYNLVVQNPIYTEEILKAKGPYREDFPVEQYTSLPEDFPDSVRELAEEITMPYANDYDKAIAIQNYLRSREFSYNLDVPYPPRGTDFVEHFLDMKEGYCVHYSTAFVVMARSVDIPARWVKGFSSGNRTSGEEYTIFDKHAHAWGEIYLPQAGWVTFEPTPGFRQTHLDDGEITDSSSQSDSEDISGEPIGEDSFDEEGSIGEVEPRQEGTLGTKDSYRFFVVLAFLVISTGAVSVIYFKNNEKKLTTDEKIILLYGKFLMKLRLVGLGKKSGETPREYMTRLNNYKNLSPNSVTGLTDVFESVYYGNNSLKEEEYHKLKKEQRRYPIIKIALIKLKKKLF